MALRQLVVSLQLLSLRVRKASCSTKFTSKTPKSIRCYGARCWAPILSSKPSSSPPIQKRFLATRSSQKPEPGGQDASISDSAKSSDRSQTARPVSEDSTSTNPAPPPAATASTIPSPPDWEDNPNYDIARFSELPYADFGVNQHIKINEEFKEALRQILWQFRAPIRYAFAYGSGVFPQSKPGKVSSSSSTTSIHSKAPPAVVTAQGGTPKMIDFIFGVSYTQHWHSLNLTQHRGHYSALGSLGSGAVSAVQDKWGAGVYFNPYVTVNGTLIKYGVVNLDTLCTDLSEWSTLYIAGRLQKPVKILRDDARVRLSNQVNLISALRTALLLLPQQFTEQELYGTIASISYLGDPRMSFPTEDPRKVANIVGNNMPNFRRLYGPLIENLPNVEFNDPVCKNRDWFSDPSTNVRLEQDMDPIKRGNMVRRLPKAFREKLYFQYQEKYQIPQLEFNKMLADATDEDGTRINRRQGGVFEQRIASEPQEKLQAEVRGVIKKTISWPSTSQSLKGVVTAGFRRSWRYMSEKAAKHRESTKKAQEELQEVEAKEDKQDKQESKSKTS